MAAGNQIARGSIGNGAVANLPPVLAKQNSTIGVSPNDNTRDTINTQDGMSRRSSQGFSVKKPKLGEPDFDYSSLNLNLKYVNRV